MAIGLSSAKRASQSENIILETILKDIIIDYKEGIPDIVTLVFHAPSVQSEYKKSYDVSDQKEKVDFNRAMWGIGVNRNNYMKQLKIISNEKILITISVNGRGFVRYIKALEESVRRRVINMSILKNIEGSDQFTKEEREVFLNMKTRELKKEFGV